MDTDNQVQMASIVNFLAGLWLIFAPFILGYARTIPRWNDIIVGIIVAIFAIWSSSATIFSSQTSKHAHI